MPCSSEKGKIVISYNDQGGFTEEMAFHHGLEM